MPPKSNAPPRIDVASYLSAFKEDVSNLDVITVIRKHITTGLPTTISEHSYWQLRQLVSDELGVHPNLIVVVGSSKLGFSLKSNKRYNLHGPKDVDVAVVSRKLFDDYWDMIFEVVRFDRGWPSRSRKNRSFVKSLFAGWISPHQLPNLATFAPARKWAEVFNSISRNRVCGIRQVSGRLYRSWDRLEAYQEILVSQCKRELEKSNERK